MPVTPSTMRSLGRPWGLLTEMLERIRPREWSLLGSIATEERCLGAWEILQANGGVRQRRMLQIADTESRFKERIDARIATRRAEFEALGGVPDDISHHGLFDPYSGVVLQADRFAASSTGHVVLDISALPKRFFFPILRRLLRSPHVHTLIAAYTAPVTYSDEELSEYPEPASHLPLYAGADPRRPIDTLVVGLGFHPLGIAEMLEGTNAGIPVHLLFPISPQPAQLRRNWAFAQSVATAVTRGKRPTFVSPVDVSEIFEHLVEMTDQARQYALLAPYGPKPMSLAMALIAHLAEWPVFYTQPRIYHPDYSQGVRRIGSSSMTYGYCIRMDGNDLYALPAVTDGRS